MLSVGCALGAVSQLTIINILFLCICVACIAFRFPCWSKSLVQLLTMVEICRVSKPSYLNHNVHLNKPP